jgi:hypothetical protein
VAKNALVTILTALLAARQTMRRHVRKTLRHAKKRKKGNVVKTNQKQNNKKTPLQWGVLFLHNTQYT